VVVLTAERLSLRRLTPTEIRTAINGGRLPATEVAGGYPLDSTLIALAAQVAARGRLSARFGHFQVVLRSRGLVIGDVAFYGPPDELGEASIVFGIVPAERGRGYATEAVSRLIAWALEQPEIRCLRTEMDPANRAAEHVVRSAGMVHTGDHDGRRHFEIRTDGKRPFCGR